MRNATLGRTLMLGALLVCGSYRAHAQQWTPLAHFVDARAVAADLEGHLYVVDAGRNVVFRLNGDGLTEAVLGGGGSEIGQFDAPSDIDPTNGLALLVADAGNGRVQRFSREFSFLGSTRIDREPPDEESAETGFPYQTGEEVVGSGRPVALSVTPSGDVFIAEELRGSILRWDDREHRLRSIAGPERSGSPRRPTSLVFDPGRRLLFVVDRWDDSIHVFDFYGTPFQRVRHPLLKGLVSVFTVRGTLWVIAGRNILRIEDQIPVIQPLPLLPEAPVDGTFAGETLYVLTSTTLLRLDP